MKTIKIEDTSEYVFDEDLKKGVWVHYKGHNIPRDVLMQELKEDWEGYIMWDVDSEDIIEILDTQEEYYYTTRYYNGADAREEGYKHWIEFTKEHKKTYGKCTNVKFRIKQGEPYKNE